MFFDLPRGLGLQYDLQFMWPGPNCIDSGSGKPSQIPRKRHEVQ